MNLALLLKRLLITVPLLLFMACTQVQTPPSTHATSIQKAVPPSRPALSTLNVLPNFYKVSPEAIGYTAAYKATDPRYLLVDWNDAGPILTSYINKGYLLLGRCDMSGPVGMPFRDDAIEYGKYLGADLIIYSAQGHPNGESDHSIAFLVKRS